MPNQKQDDIAQARSQRVRSLRDHCRYSRKRFCEQYGIKASTLQVWEDARYGGLSEAGAKQLVEVYQKEGLNCQLEWLMYGIGASPLPEEGTPLAETQRKGLITQELQLFQQHQSQTIDTIINDDSMLPAFYPGDHVAGERYYDDLSKALNVPCIVQLASGEVLVRLLQTGSKPDRYHLACLNEATAVKPLLQKDMEVLSAAPVLWLRRQPGF